MKTSFVTIAAALFFTHVTYASPAVLVEDSEINSESSLNLHHEKQIVSLSQPDSIRDVEMHRYSDTFALREKRRVGVGMSVMGQLGMAGLMLEFNLTPENALNLGFGGGPGYTSFGFDWKYLLGGQSFTPYVSAGYSMWHSATDSDGNLSNSTPSLLTSKFLSDEEKRSGQFNVSFLTPTIGLQYTQLSGEYLGWGGFIELSMMTKISNGLAMAPLASLGGIYYF